jgi:hypothetical protein
MTRGAARLIKALPPSRGPIGLTLADLVAAYQRVNARVDWSSPAFHDPFGG